MNTVVRVWRAAIGVSSLLLLACSPITQNVTEQTDPAGNKTLLVQCVYKEQHCLKEIETYCEGAYTILESTSELKIIEPQPFNIFGGERMKEESLESDFPNRITHFRVVARCSTES